MAAPPPHKGSIWYLPLRWLTVLAVTFLASCAVPTRSTAEKLQDLGGQPCPESEFTCVTLDVPLDHSHPDARSIEVTFAVLPASGTPQGVLVTAVGGPGASGVYESDFRLPSLDRAIRESFDLVYFDQRGVGMFEDPTCPKADLMNNIDYAALSDDPNQRWDSLIEITVAYVESCVSEMGDPEVLGYLGTDQAVGDLEVFRHSMGYDKLILYGESYGTSFAQTYAMTYPDAVERLVLDGTIDLTRDRIEDTVDQIKAFEDVLQRVFDACDLDRPCKKDMGMPAGEAYEALLDRLEAKRAIVLFPVEPKIFESIYLTADDLSYLAFTSLYVEEHRMMFLRALAAATSRDDLVPMIRLWELTYGSGVSTIVNTAVNCLDASVPGNDASAELEAISAARLMTQESHRRFYEFFPSCVYWPQVDRIQTPPGPFRGEGIPTLIVAAEGDPATPYSQSVSVFEELDDGYLLTVRGGSHVMFGRGLPCVDLAVTAFIFDGTKPASPTCGAEVIVHYAPLLPDSHTELEPAELLVDLDNELFYLPELVSWSWVEEKAVGCSHGGGVTFAGTDVGADYVLDGCALTEGLVISGSGEWDFEQGTSHLEVSFEGDRCSYSYTQRWDTWAETLEANC